MSDDLLFKIMDRYGFLGAITVGLSVVSLWLIWIAVCVQYPVAILTPVLVMFWMVWKVTGGKDE